MTGADRKAEEPANSGFPWNDMITLTSMDNGTRGISICLSAIHDQLVVIADLLRSQGDE